MEIKREKQLKLLSTYAGDSVIREIEKIISEEIISAVKYYVGIPDGKYFTLSDFDEEVVNAPKAYVTLNTIMGVKDAEFNRFNEGKKQVPGLISSVGIKKIIAFFTHLYFFSTLKKEVLNFETLKCARASEITLGESLLYPLTSTTKLTADEIMALGYGDKNNLILCTYRFHAGVAILDLEDLGENYLKPEEREVLLLPGNRLFARYIGVDEAHLGKDGKPAKKYEIDVYEPYFEDINDSEEDLEKIVFDEDTIKEVHDFYEALNKTDGDFPNVPAKYEEWKCAFKKLVFLQFKKIK